MNVRTGGGIGAAIVALGLVCAPSPAAAGPAPGDGRDRAGASIEAQAVATATPMVVDGRFDEPAWLEAPVIDGFVQREPAEGGEPHERTEARLVYDETALYVAIAAFDRESDRITGMLTRRDERSPSDWVKRGHRLVPRPPHRLRVRGQPGRGQDRPLLLQRRRQRRQLGRGVGRGRGPRRRGLARRVPHPLFAAPLLARWRVDGAGHHPRAAAGQPDGHLAVAGAQRQRLRVAVRRSDRPAPRRRPQAPRARCPTRSASSCWPRPRPATRCRRGPTRAPRSAPT